MALWIGYVKAWMDEKGQDLTEYALLIGLIAIVAVVAVGLLGTEVDAVFSEIVEQFPDLE